MFINQEFVRNFEIFADFLRFAHRNKMPVVSGCFCLNLKTGGLIYATLDSFGCILLALFLMTKGEDILHDMPKLLAIFCILSFFFNAALVYGIRKVKHITYEVPTFKKLVKHHLLHLNRFRINRYALYHVSY